MGSNSRRRKSLRCEFLESRLLLTADVRTHGTSDTFVRKMLAVGDYLFYENRFHYELPYEDVSYLDVEIGEPTNFGLSHYFEFFHAIDNTLYYSSSIERTLNAFDAETGETTTLSPENSQSDVTDDGFAYSPSDIPRLIVWTDFETGQSTEATVSVFDRASRFAIAETGVYFRGDHQSRGSELFRMDKVSGEIAAYEVNSVGSSFPDPVEVIGDDVYFLAETESGARELHRAGADGSLTTFERPSSDNFYYHPNQFETVGDQLYFTGDIERDQPELFRIDGDSITSVNELTGGDFRNVAHMEAFGDDLYFSATDDEYGSELRRLDGATDTVETIVVSPGFGSSPKWMEANGTDVFFGATRPDVGEELFRLDTLTGEISVKDLYPGPTGSEPGRIAGLEVAGDWVFLPAVTESGRGLMSVRIDFSDSLTCDFNGNGICGTGDIDALMGAMAGGQLDERFDLNGDGILNLDDRDLWLSNAGAKNLGPGRSYLPGDANLDGEVDVSDFNIWNSNRITNETSWSLGNFNGDSSVDVSDWNIWNGNQFKVSGNLVTLSNRQFFTRYVTEADDHGAFQDFEMRLSSQWFLNTTEVGTTIQNRETGRFLVADEWEVFTADVADSSLPLRSKLWTVVNNFDGSVAFRNQSTGRVMDGDDGSEGWDVDESASILFDDGWFVTAVGTGSTQGEAPNGNPEFVAVAELVPTREKPKTGKAASLIDSIFAAAE